MSQTVFLSTVTKELGPLRQRFAALARRTQKLHVRHQDDFVESGVLTLLKLQEEIEASHVVLHVIGAETGAAPPIEQVESLLIRLPDFATKFPDVVELARQRKVTYTQWEAWLGVYYHDASGKRLCCYELSSRLTAAEGESLSESQQAQRDHAKRLAERKFYAKSLADDQALYDEMLLTLVELNLLTKLESRPPIKLPYLSMGTLFKGRESFLDQIRASLQRGVNGSATAITGKAVHGLGGVGKTRLAVEYAWQSVDEFSAVLFLPADSPESLRQNLAQLTGPLVLNLPEQVATEEEVRMAAALRWLDEHRGWFLILDNVDTEAAAQYAEELLTRLHGGQALITSRLARWGDHVQPLELDVLPKDAATSFLLERTQPQSGGRGRKRQASDPTDAETLAGELDGLALALEQAGAYIVSRRISLAEYLQLWRQHDVQVQTWHNEREMKYPRSVAVTWQTTFEQLDNGAITLLNLLAWFAPDPVPLSVFERPSELSAISQMDSEANAEIAEADDPMRGIEDFRGALVLLADFSLLRWDNDSRTVAVHRVVQEILRTRQTNPPQTEWVTRSLGLLSLAVAVGPADDVRTWPTWEPLRAHISFATSEADRLGVAEPTASLMNGLGVLLASKALHAEAEPLMRRALAIDEQSYGAEHPDVARDLNNLAQLLQATNRLAEAEPLMRRALAIFEQSYGVEHPNVAVNLNNLAQLLQDTNRLAEAEPLMRRALAIDEQSYGAEHPRVAIDLNNLALLLKATNRLAEAEPLMRRVVEIFEKFHRTNGHEHPHMQKAITGYVGVLRQMKRTRSETIERFKSIGIAATRVEAAMRPAPKVQVPKTPLQVPTTPGRNEPCSCGSGKKYKKCCGVNS